MVKVLGRAFLAAMIFGAVLLFADTQSPADAARKSSQANTLVQAGRPEQAIPIYKELAAAFPEQLSFEINLAIALYKSGRYQETIDECSALLKRQPDLFPAWLFLGASHLKLGAASVAEGPLRKALAIQRTDPNARIMLADALLAMGHWAEAADQYGIAAQAIPDSPRIWYGLGRSYDGLAEEALTRIESVAPGSAQALALSAEFEFDRNQVVSAFQRCREALALQPSFRGIRALVAEIYEATGHPDWATAERTKSSREGSICVDARSLECEFVAGHVQEVAAAKADSPEAVYWQSKAFLALSRQAYARLRELPPSRESYEAAAIAEEKRGLYPEAAAAWKEALQFEPANAQLQRRLALALCHSNDCVSALPLLKNQLAHEPNSVELNYLFGLALNSTRNPGQALPYLENAVRLNGNFLPARAALGEAYLEAGRPERAIPQLKAAAAEDENGSRHYQLAQAYQAVGLRDQSLAVLREYREIVRRRDDQKQNESRITPP
jgi:predicted Zn-dependent protease